MSLSSARQFFQICFHLLFPRCTHTSEVAALERVQVAVASSQLSKHQTALCSTSFIAESCSFIASFLLCNKIIFEIWLLLLYSATFISVSQFQLWPYIALCVCVLSHSVVSDSLRPHGLQPARPLCPWNSPGKNTGMGCHFLLQGRAQQFATWTVVHGILQARILEWVAFPISRISSQPRDRTQVSPIAADSLPAELSGKPYLPDIGIKSASLVSPALAGRFFTTEPPGKPSFTLLILFISLFFQHLCMCVCVCLLTKYFIGPYELRSCFNELLLSFMYIFMCFIVYYLILKSFFFFDAVHF